MEADPADLASKVLMLLLKRKREAMKASEKPSKLKELIVHVARRCQDDERFNLDKLGRILFYADFWAYCQAGSSITGAEHRVGDHAVKEVRERGVREPGL